MLEGWKSVDYVYLKCVFHVCFLVNNPWVGLTWQLLLDPTEGTVGRVKPLAAKAVLRSPLPRCPLEAHVAC